jgi:hypothetical protein
MSAGGVSLTDGTAWTADQWSAYMDQLDADPADDTGCESCQ